MICACYRHTNKVVVIHSYQLYGVRLEGFHSWQRVFFLYLYPFVPDGAEKDCIEIPYLLCGDCGHTAALRLPSPGHRNYFVDLHIVYSGDDTRGTLCLNLYRYNESQRIDCGHVLAKNSSEHYHYIRYGIALFPTFSEEIHNIYDAMKLRGIALSWKNVFTRPVLILEAIAIPIVMRSASIAEELSASAVTRGIDNPAQRTSFIQLKVHAKDWMVLCFFLIAFVVLFFCKYQIYGRI